MRNLKSFSGNTIDFHDLVLKNKYRTKNDETYKDRVQELRAQIVEKFDEYDLLFASKELANLVSAGFVDQDKTDLLNLYSYKSRAIQELKIEITTLENNRILNTCQNCTINEINSFDHFLPKEEFAEFIVNPKNLIPSCTACNSFKTAIWKAGNSMLFLNLYLDELPNSQYLFVNITVADNIIDTEFYLDNRNCIDAPFFDVIKSHYGRLHLPERFSDNRNDTITELENLIYAYRNRLPREEIIDAVEQKVKLDKLSFGHNYWKAILQQSLINSDIFMNRLFI
ncbi:MAG: hypothetical protein WA584_08435 [Pyrinomonadaceae bacterium]